MRELIHEIARQLLPGIPASETYILDVFIVYGLIVLLAILAVVLCIYLNICLDVWYSRFF